MTENYSTDKIRHKKHRSEKICAFKSLCKQHGNCKRNNINGYTNLATMANLMYAVDLTENIVVFTLADPTITP